MLPSPQSPIISLGTCSPIILLGEQLLPCLPSGFHAYAYARFWYQKLSCIKKLMEVRANVLYKKLAQ